MEGEPMPANVTLTQILDILESIMAKCDIPLATAAQILNDLAVPFTATRSAGPFEALAAQFSKTPAEADRICEIAFENMSRKEQQ
jgi:hypothetical protein